MHLQTISAILAFTAAVLAAPAPDATVQVPSTAVLAAPISKRDTYTGEGTVYLQEGGEGSCGEYNSDSSVIGALSNYWMQNESPGPYCGRQVVVTNTGSDDGVGGAGNTVTVTIEDTCPSCDEGHIDFSVGAWNQLTNNAAYGTIDISWYFA